MLLPLFFDFENLNLQRQKAMTTTARTTIPAAMPALAPVLMPCEAAEVVFTSGGLSEVLLLLLVVLSVPVVAIVATICEGAPEVY